MKGLGLPFVAHQRVALEKSGEALETGEAGRRKAPAIRASLRRDAKRIIEGEKALDRAEKLLEATEREGKALQDPATAPGAMPEMDTPCRPRKWPRDGR